LEKNFVDTIKKNFDGEVEQVDFSNAASSSKTINDWVLTKTNNKINDLISEQSIDPLLKLVLVNAIYFKGNQIRTLILILFILNVFSFLNFFRELVRKI
jgi:serine protease inhibitor